jgi:hypothetical protein
VSPGRWHTGHSLLTRDAQSPHVLCMQGMIVTAFRSGLIQRLQIKYEGSTLNASNPVMVLDGGDAQAN